LSFSSRENQPNNSYTYGIWQFGGETNLIRTNKIAGLVCDQNYSFKDYANLIKKKGFNGYKKDIKLIENEIPKDNDLIIEKPVINYNPSNNVFIIAYQKLKNIVKKIFLKKK